MFRSARMRLTAWYVGFLALILILFDLAVGGLLGRNLTARLQDDLKSKAAQASAAVLDVGGSPYFERSGLFADPGWSDVSLFATTSTGGELQKANPAAGTILPAREGMNAALQGRADFSTVETKAGSFLVYTLPVLARRPPGFASNIIAVVQVARSTESVAAAVSHAAELLALGTLIALLCAFFGGLWLAGKALDPIRESLNRQKQFVADASHELRTPVTIIRTAAESILRQKDPPTPKVKSLAEDIVTESAQLGRLVGELGELSDADSRLTPLARAPVQVNWLLAEVVASGRLLAESASVRLEADIAGATGTVHGDGARLRQLFSIITDNAVKFSPKSSPVVLSASSADGKLTVRVADRGAGIAAADLPRIFERFFRGAAERRRAGAGLGLSIARTIVDQHKGTIAVRSEPGEGTEFIVELPLGESAAG